MRTVLIVLGLLMSIDALADAKAGEKKAQLCLLCHKPVNVMASAPLLEAQPAKYLVQATTEYKMRGKQPGISSANLKPSREVGVRIRLSTRLSTK
jgi:cytochrome c553